MCSVLPVNIFNMTSSKGPECGMKATEEREQEKSRPDPLPDDKGENKEQQTENIPEICVTPPPLQEDEQNDANESMQSLDGSLLNSSSDSCLCDQHCCSPTGVAQLVVPTYSGPSYPDFKVATLKPWQCARSRKQRKANCKRMQLINKCDCRLDPMA